MTTGVIIHQDIHVHRQQRAGPHITVTADSKSRRLPDNRHQAGLMQDPARADPTHAVIRVQAQAQEAAQAIQGLPAAHGRILRPAEATVHGRILRPAEAAAHGLIHQVVAQAHAATQAPAPVVHVATHRAVAAAAHQGAVVQAAQEAAEADAKI